MIVENKIISQRSSDTQQVDLIDVIIQLWRAKMTIVIFVIFALILATGYIVFAKQKWTSTAIITQPDAGQIAAYNNALNVLYGGGAPKLPDLQNSFIVRFSAAFSALSAELDNQDEPEKLTIDSSVKGQPLPLAVSYVGESAEIAQRQLAQYIQKVDELVAKELDVDLRDNIRLQTINLEDSLKTQEQVAQEQKDMRIKQIQEALKYANEANIVKPQPQQIQDVTQDSMFLLGSEALTAMIQNESTRPLALSPNYYQTKQNLLDIKNIKVDPDSIHAYRYVLKPTLPVHRDSPKKVVTLVLAALLGAIIGTGVVICRNAFRTYPPRA